MIIAEERFLEFTDPSNHVEPESSWLHINVPGVLGISAICFLGQYFVPLSLLERWGKIEDIVYPDSKRCCCFTKSYYQLYEGHWLPFGNSP
ncbi:hypothetical protein RJ639_016458, partial [Escallonia herrerae]